MGSNPSSMEKPKTTVEMQHPVTNGFQEIQEKTTEKIHSIENESIKSATEFESDNEGDVLFHSENIDPQDLMHKANIAIEKIRSTQNDRTQDGAVTLDFRKASLLLLEILTIIIEQKTSSAKSDLVQKFTKCVVEKQTVDIYCRVCSEILDKGSSVAYPGIEKVHEEPLDTMLSFLVNASDNNADMCTVISHQTNFLEKSMKKLQQWTETHCNETENEVTESSVLELLCTILHNVAMFEDNVPRIRAVRCINAMKPYLDSKDKTVRLLSLATLADLVNESESEIIKSNGDVIRYLLYSVAMAMGHESGTWDGWSLTELVRIVRQIARNDNNKRTVVQHGAVPTLLKLTGSEDIEEQREAVAALWTLSFDKQNREEMLHNKEWKVLETLEKLSKSQDETVQKTSTKAIWTIKDHEVSSGDSNGKQSKSGDSHVMISYNWGHQKMVKQIRDHLRNKGIKVWMDVDDMQGSTLQAMASAVEKADIVMVCYSLKYKNSDNCRAEAEYAFQLKKKIIPVRMEQNYKADGWLGFIIGAKLFYDFSGKYPFENKITELIREVHEAQNRSKGVIVAIPDKPVRAHREPTVESFVQAMSGNKTQKNKSDEMDAVKKWTSSEVDNWLNSNNLPKKLLGRLRGKDIAFLSILVHESPSTFYEVIRQQLGVKDIHIMSDLRFALDGIDTDKSNPSSSL